MEENILEKLLQEKYSIKQMIGYFIVGYNNAEDKSDCNKILNSITTSIIEIDKNKLLDMIDRKYIEGIDLFWRVNVEQMLAYAYIVFRNLFRYDKEILIEDIIEEFKQTSKLESPNNA